MAVFEIDGKEYELKLTYKSIKYLNNQFEGGSYELIGMAMSGDFDTFPKIVLAGLFHTDKGFTLKDVEDAIEELIDKEALSMEDVAKISDEVVTQSFFYKETIDRVLKSNPEAKEQLELLRG